MAFPFNIFQTDLDFWWSLLVDSFNIFFFNFKYFYRNLLQFYIIFAYWQFLKLDS